MDPRREFLAPGPYGPVDVCVDAMGFDFLDNPANINDAVEAHLLETRARIDRGLDAEKIAKG